MLHIAITMALSKLPPGFGFVRYTPSVELKDYMYVGCDPKEQLLLGPAYGQPALAIDAA